MKKNQFSHVLALTFLFWNFVCAEADEWKILKPSEGPEAYEIAASEFQQFYHEITEVRLEIVSSPDSTSNLIVIGPDFVNRYTRDAIERKVIPTLDLGSGKDNYKVLSAQDPATGQKLLFLAGGTGRSTLYAVYHYFEQEGGCRYFWDGDIVPKADSLNLEQVSIAESPRFMYRGLRYFAHRSLSRFQAEHWGPEEWEKEIDWIVKKRLNLFMLRIGMDDIFQKAFPDLVPYPPVDQSSPEAIPRSFYDRTTAWPLQYRGELRKHVLHYAAQRGLIHPEDMGTMTHWYSCTPKAFLEAVKPTFNPQSGGAYLGNPTNAVWDIRDDRNLDNYWKLTQTHVEQYGRPEMFHTIGIAERETFDNRADNLEMKLYAYRRILTKLREHYPTAPVLIASWDFYLPGWKGEEIGKLLQQLDPTKTIILDYTSDLPSNETNTHFENWGVVNKFPYTFGIFHAYEWENDLRGNYDLIEKRISAAAEDPMCKGFVFWPETSHSDPLMLEFFTHNAWNPDIRTPQQILPQFCADRYGERYAPFMQKGWEAAMPVYLLADRLPLMFKDLTSFSKRELTPEYVAGLRKTLEEVSEEARQIPSVLETLSQLPFGEGNAFIDRDAIDLARSVIARLTTIELYRYAVAQSEFLEGRQTAGEVRKVEAEVKAAMKALRDVLSLHDDYSLQASVRQMEAVRSPLNPAFENALKGNSENDYCRSFIREYFDYYYLPQLELYTREVRRSLKEGSAPSAGKMDMNPIIDAFYERPLHEMKPLSTVKRNHSSYEKCLKRLASQIEK